MPTCMRSSCSVEVAHVDAVERHASAGHVVQARRQRRERRLARTGEPDQRHGLARAQHEVDAVEQIALAGGGILIAEVHALERELAARRGDRRGLVGIDDRVLLVEHLEDAVGRRARVEQ